MMKTKKIASLAMAGLLGAGAFTATGCGKKKIENRRGTF